MSKVLLCLALAIAGASSAFADCASQAGGSVFDSFSKAGPRVVNAQPTAPATPGDTKPGSQ